MFKAGEKPGIGTYKCLECGELVTLDDPDDILPPCPVCHYTEYEEIQALRFQTTASVDDAGCSFSY